MKIRKQGLRRTAGGGVETLRGRTGSPHAQLAARSLFTLGQWPGPCGFSPPAHGHLWAVPHSSAVTDPPATGCASPILSSCPSYQTARSGSVSGAHLEGREFGTTLLGLPGKVRAGASARAAFRASRVRARLARQRMVAGGRQVADGGSWPWGTFKGGSGGRSMAGTAGGWRCPSRAKGLPAWTDPRLGSCCLGPHL